MTEIPDIVGGHREMPRTTGMWAPHGATGAQRGAHSQIDDLATALARFPRYPLVRRPTPLHKLEAVTATLGGPAIWIKRDDLTGLAFGGNKSRKLEFILPDLVAQGAEVMVTWGALQSNWAMQAAAACTRAGIHPVLVLFRRYDLAPEHDGNMLLDRILGADIRLVEPAEGLPMTNEEALATAEAVADEFRARGKQVYTVSVGGSMPMGSMTEPWGAVGYADAFVEVFEQCRALGFSPDAVVHSTGSGSTQAGLVVGATALSPQTRVVGISVTEEKAPFVRDILAIAEATAGLLGLPAAPVADDIVVLDEYLDEGYGVVNQDVTDTIRLMLRAEGIVLDPVYTAKAFAGLIDLVERGYFAGTRNVVFVHTGGTPALFPNRDRIVELLG